MLGMTDESATTSFNLDRKKNITKGKKTRLDGFVLSKHMYTAAVLRSNTFSFSPLLAELALPRLR